MDLDTRRSLKGRRGFADYIPVAYRSMGFDSDRVGAADNHVRAHFLLYMARDCSHFVLKWEIPVPVLLPQDMGAPTEITPEYYTHNVGPGVPKSRLVRIENKARNIVLRSYQIGRLKRIWTGGPLNAIADAAHAGGEAAESPAKWGALITCGIFLGSETPIAAYATPESDYGDDLSGGVVLEISPAHQRILQTAARMKSVTPQAAPMSWRITANVFNASYLREIARLKSVAVQINFWGGTAMDVIGLFMIYAYPPSGALDALSVTLGLTLPDSIPNVLDPLDVTWFVFRACVFAIIKEEIGNLGEIAVVRLGFMTAAEPFQVAPGPMSASAVRRAERTPGMPWSFGAVQGRR